MSHRSKRHEAADAALAPVRTVVRSHPDSSPVTTVSEPFTAAVDPGRGATEPTDDVRPAALARRLEEHDCLHEARDRLYSLGDAGWHALNEEVASAAASFLEQDVESACLRAWSGLPDLGSGPERAQGGRHEVQVRAHHLTVEAEPSIDVALGEEVLTTVPLRLTVDVEVPDLTVEVQGGELLRVEPEPELASVRLTAYDVVLATRRVPLDRDRLHNAGPVSVDRPEETTSPVLPRT